MKNLLSIIALLGINFVAESQVKLHCPTSCRPILSCDKCWTSVQQATENGCSITSLSANNFKSDIPTFEIYPNPGETGNFFIKNQNNLYADVQVLDQVGRTLLNFTLAGESIYKLEEILKPGLYHFRLINPKNGQVVYTKLVVR